MESLEFIRQHNKQLEILLIDTEYWKGLNERRKEIPKDTLKAFVFLESHLSKAISQAHYEKVDVRLNGKPSLMARFRKLGSKLALWGKEHLLPELAKKINGYIKNAIMPDAGTPKT